MVEAIILIQTEIGKAEAVVAAASLIPGVTSAEALVGSYDCCLRAEADDMDLLGKLVISEVQALEGVTRSLSCPVVHL